MIKIYMPYIFPAPLMEGWGDDVVLDVNRTGEIASREEMKEHLKDADVCVINLEDEFDKEMIDASPNLKVLWLFAESTYNIDVEYLKEKGIVLGVTPGEIFENTADLTWAILMAAARRIPEADRYIRDGKYKAWGPDVLLGADLYNKTIGILGMGTIGQLVARRATGFNMNILYNAKHGPKPAVEEAYGAKFVSREELLRESDFVCLHVKLTEETEHLIGKDELAMMKPSAVLVNTGRGKLIDEEALADALENGVIAAAALDVFEEEPKVTEKLLSLPNVVMTPHLGASSKENRYRMSEIAANGIRKALGL